MRRFSLISQRLWFAWIVAVLWLAIPVFDAIAAEALPPKPKRYFNDYAGVVSDAVENELNRKLEAFEKSNSSQVIVAIYPKLQSRSSLEDFTLRVAESWGVGQKATDNGAVLFVFVQDRALRIEVGYGLEGAIPDALAKRIIDDEIVPHLRTGNFDQAMRVGVDSILKAATGEYRGTGRTVAQVQRRKNEAIPILIFVVLFILISVASSRRRRGVVYGGRGRRRSSWGGSTWVGGGGGWGGGGFGGGGGFFSGGGGSFGGGGASGRW